MDPKTPHAASSAIEAFCFKIKNLKLLSILT
nr:MAG TPA: protein of unknown function DUF2301 [Caudoviricetes sp.]